MCDGIGHPPRARAHEPYIQRRVRRPQRVQIIATRLQEWLFLSMLSPDYGSLRTDLPKVTPERPLASSSGRLVAQLQPAEPDAANANQYPEGA